MIRFDLTTPSVPTVGAVAACPAPMDESTRERLRHGGVTFEEATRARAYQLWERAGRPAGDGVGFWLEAEAELAAARG